MKQNFSFYYVFYVVAKNKNISKAAKELYISQPAISKSIAKLEASLDTTLFYRTSKGVSLTYEGEILYEHISSAFESISLGEDTLREISDQNLGQIRIGVSTTLCKFILLPYLKTFIEAYPKVKLSIECQSTFQTLQLLEENKLDIGLVGKPSTHLDSYYPLGEIEDIFVVSPSYLKHLAIDSAPFSPTISMLSNANLMLLDEENISRVYIEEYFKSNDIKPNQILEVSTMDLLIEFAKIGLGVACVIKEFVSEPLETGELLALSLDVPIEKRSIGFVVSKRGTYSKAVQNFLSFVSFPN